jgi:hypothetical protein
VRRRAVRDDERRQQQHHGDDTNSVQGLGLGDGARTPVTGGGVSPELPNVARA